MMKLTLLLKAMSNGRWLSKINLLGLFSSLAIFDLVSLVKRDHQSSSVTAGVGMLLLHISSESRLHCRASQLHTACMWYSTVNHTRSLHCVSVVVLFLLVHYVMVYSPSAKPWSAQGCMSADRVQAERKERRSWIYLEMSWMSYLDVRFSIILWVI